MLRVSHRIRFVICIAALAVCSFAELSSAKAAKDVERWDEHLKLTFSDRFRVEYVDWFRPPDAVTSGSPEEYTFVANRLRLGATLTFPSWQAVLEIQDTRILNLPNDASLAAPFGNLGPGAVYYANSRDRNQGSTFIKSGYLTVRRSGFALSGGRMDLSDGLETLPGDRTLLWLKEERIGQRLLGPFGYTHVSRSFDVSKLSWDRRAWNLTGFGGRPTQGGFEVDANEGLDDVHVAGLAWTVKSLPKAPPVDLRVFYLFYRDAREAPTPTDNRPIGARQSDDGTIAVHSMGGHALTAVEWGPGSVDALAWGVVQAGQWGRLGHFGWAYALELGYRMARWPASPWLRIGWNRSSGDDDPSDSQHETFFQVLPTARIYARLPFYNAMNNNDVFAQLVLRPHPRVRFSADYHWLSLTERRDLWYYGGGATNQRIFGFSGSPANGAAPLAHLADVSVTLGPWKGVELSTYYGHAFGRGVVQNLFAGTDADYFFSEVTLRYSR